MGLGCIAAGYISHIRGMITEEEFLALRDVFTGFGLPGRVDGLDWEDVGRTAKSDKKMEAGVIKFILLKAIGHACVDKSVTTVSYTHLDVYKRQVVYLDKSAQHMYELNNKIRLINVNEFPIKSSEGFLGFICGIISQDHDLETMYPVSYTHLDVYKRQEQASGKRSHACFCGGWRNPGPPAQKDIPKQYVKFCLMPKKYW